MATSLLGSTERCEQEMVADCTCPVCQELFQHPQRLAACRHTLCRRCIKKMMSSKTDPMEEATMSFGLFAGLLQRSEVNHPPGSVCCPICREMSSKFEPDETIDYLVNVLRAMRSQSRCSFDDSCMTEAAIECPCCNKLLCRSHYAAQMTALKDSGVALLKELDCLLTNESSNEPLGQLQSAIDNSMELESVLVEQTRSNFEAFRQDAILCSEQLQAHKVEDEAQRSALLLDRATLRRMSSSEDSGKMARLLPEVKARVQLAKKRWPERQLVLQFNSQALQEQFSGLFARHVSSATFRSPYAHLPDTLTKVRQQKLTQKPWDIGILWNLDGIVSCNGAVRLRSSVDKSSCTVKEFRGPLLVINAQCFPTKMLHVTDMEVHQVATITPQFGEEGMPGRMYIYNERQLILTSDATRHRVTVFNLEGGKVASFGEKGSAPGQFHEPLGLGAFDGQMFVVDAKNKRVQVFDMDNDYNCLATIQHAEFTDGLQSVLSTSSSIFVVDREKSRVCVFDRTSRYPVAPVLKLQSKPFDVVSDEFGNALVTLVQEGKVVAVHRSGGVLKTIDFKETAEKDQSEVPTSPFDFMMMPMMGLSGGPPRMFHGVAFEASRRRLFIADLMRSCIVVTEL